VRAKRTLTAAKVPFELPRGEELEVRVSSVLEVIYLIFNEGYSATSGEVHALVALMELRASRARARTGPHGEVVLLMDHDRSRWDQMLIGRGRATLAYGPAGLTRNARDREVLLARATDSDLRGVR